MNLFSWALAVVIAVLGTIGGEVYINCRLNSKVPLSLNNVGQLIHKRNYIIYFISSVILILTIFLVSGLYEFNILKCFRNMTMVMLAIPIAYFDYRKKIIPNFFIITGVVIWAVFFLIEWLIGGLDWLSLLKFSLFGLLLGGGVLLISLLIARNGIGMGDVKLFAVIGLVYGFSNTFLIMIISLFIMAIIGIILMVRKKATKKSMLPMAPFLLIGLVVSCLIGV